MEKERILVVDDDAILAMGLQRLLQGWGYELAGMAYSGEEAVIKARVISIRSYGKRATISSIRAWT
ncbi:transcriptional regulator [Candidatus Magnetobacterium bavaricum]|uniref:Transcriptional regulator n=1 Tax=Candidatus Magnetobacterium bavaricum TaxID=29290 RepID=A0A0F3GU48_9BACT|nr:transcriptional regulator [Candidatus Magnetobacterium bavaricum]